MVLAAERNVTRAAAILCPTLVALVLYLGVIGLLDVAIDPVNLVVLPLLIGLGVDDSVYLVAHARHGGLRPCRARDLRQLDDLSIEPRSG